MAKTNGIRILHLSDFHFNAAKAWDAEPVRRDLANFIGKEVETDGAPDLVVITGDLAFSGIADEYALAERWLGDLWNKLGDLPRDRLLLVPGNHDVDRTKVGSGVRFMQDGLLVKRSQQQIADLLTNEDEQGPMLKRHTAYLDFVADWLGERQALPWWQRLINIRGTTLHVAGLDSAWMACSDSDATKLLLGDYQLNNTVSTENAEDAHWRIALMHHPWDDLAAFERYDARATVHRRRDLLLRGHLHFPAPERVSPPDPARGCLELPTGCVYQTSKYPNAFQWIELLPTRLVHVLFRAWVQGAWAIDRNQPNCPQGYWPVDLGSSYEIKPQPDDQSDMKLKTPLPSIQRKSVKESAGHPHVIHATDGKVMLLIRPERSPWFYVEKYPVTARQYCWFLRMINDTRLWKNPWRNWPDSDDFPVTNVSPEDAAAYARHFGKRLPTLNEWRMAASGGVESFLSYPWGDEFEKERCNSLEYWRGMPEPTIVGKFGAQNDAGVCDIVGNIYEIAYCDTSRKFTLVGGFYGSDRDEIQIAPHASRSKDHPFQPTMTIGFRCVANCSSEH